MVANEVTINLDELPRNDCRYELIRHANLGSFSFDQSRVGYYEATTDVMLQDVFDAEPAIKFFNQVLCRFYLSHQELMPEDFFGGRVLFLGTMFKNPEKEIIIPGIDFDGGYYESMVYGTAQAKGYRLAYLIG